MKDSSNPFWLRYIPGFIRSKLEGRHTLYAIIHNTGWLLGDKALRLGLGLLVGAWVARYLGPSQFGELSYVLAFVAFFQTISLLGLDGIAIRDMARDRKASPAILGTVFRLRLITGVLCWLSAIGSMALFRPGDQHTLVLTAIVSGSLVFQAADTVDLWFQSQTQSKRTVLAKTFAYVLNSLFKIGLILAEAPLLYFAVAGLIEFAFAAVALSFSYRMFPAPFNWRWDLEWSKRLLNESWPYMLSGLAIIIYMRIDQIMLREMCGTHELGVYSAALPLSTTWYFIPIIISRSVGAAIAKKKKFNPDEYEYAIDKLFGLMWLIMLPITIIIAGFSGLLIRLLYGDLYLESINVLMVHIFSNIPVGLGVIQEIWIINEKKNKLSLYKTLIGAIANILLNTYFIVKYGAVGAAFSSVISYLISSVFSNLIFAPKIFKRQVSGVWSFIGVKKF